MAETKAADCSGWSLARMRKEADSERFRHDPIAGTDICQSMSDVIHERIMASYDATGGRPWEERITLEGCRDYVERRLWYWMGYDECRRDMLAEAAKASVPAGVMQGRVKARFFDDRKGETK